MDWSEWQAELMRRIDAYEAAGKALEEASRLDEVTGDIAGPGPDARAYMLAKAAADEAEGRLWETLPGTDVPGRGNAVAYRGWLYLAGPDRKVLVAYLSEDLDGTAKSVAWTTPGPRPDRN